MSDNIQPQLQRALLALRLGVFIVMAIWVVDKFLRPDHTATVYENFYLIGGLDINMSYVIGAVQGLVVLGFVAGMFKRWTYGLVLLMHAISTLSSYNQYMDPYAEGTPNILFFAAWPMLAACYALYVLRDHDTLLTLGCCKKTAE